jgi:hypothetical protein
MCERRSPLALEPADAKFDFDNISALLEQVDDPTDRDLLRFPGVRVVNPLASAQ